MEQFDDSIKLEFPDTDMPREIERMLGVLHKLKVSECDGIALSNVSKMPAQIIILLQVCLRRTIELTEAAIREINRHNLATSALLARGAFETTCMLWDTMREIDRVEKAGKTAQMDTLVKRLEQSLLGGKAEELRIDKSIESLNVITIIKRLSKELDAPLWGFFERLSEFAHPNYHGLFATYTEPGATGGIKQFCDARSSAKRALISTALGALATSCRVVIKCYEMTATNIVGITTLAERTLFEANKWPSDVAYPVKRS